MFVGHIIFLQRLSGRILYLQEVVATRSEETRRQGDKETGTQSCYCLFISVSFHNYHFFNFSTFQLFNFIKVRG